MRQSLICLLSGRGQGQLGFLESPTLPLSPPNSLGTLSDVYTISREGVLRTESYKHGNVTWNGNSRLYCTLNEDWLSYVLSTVLHTLMYTHWCTYVNIIGRRTSEKEATTEIPSVFSTTLWRVPVHPLEITDPSGCRLFDVSWFRESGCL